MRNVTGVQKAISLKLIKNALAGSPHAQASLRDSLLNNPIQRAIFGDETGYPLVEKRLNQFAKVHRHYCLSLTKLGVPRPRYDLLWSLILPISELVQQLASQLGRAPVVGICGGAGAGKTSLAYGLASVLEAQHSTKRDVLILSLEDFYLSASERAARGFPWRATPGTHDVQRLKRVIQSIQQRDEAFSVPRYSLSKDAPLPDDVVHGEFSCCIFEGWLVGSTDPRYQSITTALDFLIFVGANERDLRTWRFEREARIRLRSDALEGIPSSKLMQFWKEVLGPGLHQWVLPVAQNANLVLKFGCARTIVEAYYRPCSPLSKSSNHPTD